MADASASARQMAGDQAVDVTAAQSYRGLRGWIDTVDRLGELKRVSGAHWDVEMGAITHMLTEKSGGTAPAILFDDVPGYSRGYRCLYGMMCSPRRFAYTIGGIDVSSAGSTMEYLKRYRERMKDVQYIPPVEVKSSPVFENVLEGDAVEEVVSSQAPSARRF